MLMSEIERRQAKGADGAWVATLNAHCLQTAFQTIFRFSPNGALTPYSAEALCRISKNEIGVSITAFLDKMRPSRVLLADCSAMALHVRNFVELEERPKKLFVNADPRSAHFLAQVHHALFEFAAYVEGLGLSTSDIVVELTEERAQSEEALSFTAMALRKFGFRIAIDDFGARASNLIRLVNLRPDYLKFDRLWLCRILEHDESRALLASKVARLQNLGVKLVAEGLETGEQVALTREAGIDLFQGYKLQRPELCPFYRPYTDTSYQDPLDGAKVRPDVARA